MPRGPASYERLQAEEPKVVVVKARKLSEWETLVISTTAQEPKKLTSLTSDEKRCEFREEGAAR
jgi:hypothetical protein